MTDFVEQMMQTAGVKPKTVAELGSTYNPEYMEIENKLYPGFTAEKQLKLIKLIATTNNIALHKSEISKGWLFTSLIKGGFRIAESQDFTQALAQLAIRVVVLALQKIDNIITSAGFGIDDKAILSLVKPILKILNEVKDAD